MNAEFHEHHIETEVRHGVTRRVLVITTDIPIPPETHIDKDMLPTIVQGIERDYADKGQSYDEVRLVHRGASNA